MALKRIGVCVAVLAGLLLALSPATASPAKKAKHGASKLGVHAVTAAGHSAGHVRLSIRGTGKVKKHMTRYTNRHGRYKSRALPAGTYAVTGRRHGMRSASGSMNVTGAGTHTLTLRMTRRSAAVVRRGHTRSTHALGTKAAAKAKAASASTGKAAGKSPGKLTHPSGVRHAE